MVTVTSLIGSGAGWTVITEESAKRITCQDSHIVADKIRWYTTLTVLLFLCPNTGKISAFTTVFFFFFSPYTSPMCSNVSIYAFKLSADNSAFM